jgi:hypothetical protein
MTTHALSAHTKLAIEKDMTDESVSRELATPTRKTTGSPVQVGSAAVTGETKTNVKGIEDIWKDTTVEETSPKIFHPRRNGTVCLCLR